MNTNYTISEIVTLPSLGKLYSPEIDPQVSLRSMSTADEMKRLSQTEFPYRTMCEIIKDCITTPVSVHPYDMCIGDYLFLLHRLRIVTYGADYTLSSICPFCGHNNIDTVNLDDLGIKTYTDDVLKYFNFKLPRTEKEIKIRFQTPRMLDSVTQRVSEHKKKSKDKSVDPTIIYTVANLIEEIDHSPVDVIRAEDFVRELPMLDTQTILAHADKINQEIGLDLDLESVCDVCNLTFSTSFRMTSEFFRPTLDV